VLIAMLLVDTVGRRPLLLWGSSITAVAMLAVAAVSSCLSQH
jgi:Sugar (and other) transporter